MQVLSVAGSASLLRVRKKEGGPHKSGLNIAYSGSLLHIAHTSTCRPHLPQHVMLGDLDSHGDLGIYTTLCVSFIYNTPYCMDP